MGAAVVGRIGGHAAPCLGARLAACRDGAIELGVAICAVSGGSMVRASAPGRDGAAARPYFNIPGRPRKGSVTGGERGSSVWYICTKEKSVCFGKRRKSSVCVAIKCYTASHRVRKK